MMESELIPLFPTPLYCATLDFEKDEDFDQYIRQLEYARSVSYTHLTLPTSDLV